MAEGRLTAKKLRKEMGNPKATVPEMRDYLESMGIDRHTRIEMPSFDAILVSLDGDRYGYRRVAEQKDENKEFSMFGGTVLEETVTAENVANVIMAKTPITGIVPEQVTLYHKNEWSSEFEYANGDKVYFIRSCAIIYINDEQEEQLIWGDEAEFHYQILGVVELTKREHELYDYQQIMYNDVLKMSNISE